MHIGFSPISMNPVESHSASITASRRQSEYSDGFRIMQGYENFYCTDIIETYSYCNLNCCFRSCVTSHDCNYITWLPENICYLHDDCRMLRRIGPRSQDRISSYVYQQVEQNNIVLTQPRDVVVVTHASNSSIFWNSFEYFVNEFNGITTDMIKTSNNVSLMADSLMQYCMQDKRIITTDPYEVNSSEYNMLHNSIDFCIQNNKRVVLMQSANQLTLPFVGQDELTIGKRCAGLLINENYTTYNELLQIVNYTVLTHRHYLDENNHVIDVRETAFRNELFMQGVNLTTLNLTSPNHQPSDKIVCFGVDACDELDMSGISYDMNCGDGVKNSSHYGVSVKSQAIASVLSARNITLPNDYKVYTDAIRIERNLTTSQSDSTQPTECKNHTGFRFVGSYYYENTRDVISIDSIELETFGKSSVQSFSADYCSKLKNCNGFSLHFDRFNTIKTVQFVKQVNEATRGPSLRSISCTYEKTQTFEPNCDEINKLETLRTFLYDSDAFSNCNISHATFNI